MNIFSAIWTLIKATFTTPFTAVSGSVNVILGELPDDQFVIIHGALLAFDAKLQAGNVADALSAAWAYVEQAEGAELSKLGKQVLSLLIEATTPAA